MSLPTMPSMASGTQATLLYSEFVFARGSAATATKIMCGYANLKRTTPIHPPRLKFLTLFKLEMGRGGDAVVSPCTPRW